MRLVILESPYAGIAGDPNMSREQLIDRNTVYARAALRHSLSLGEAPLALHLLYTQPGVLRDDVPAERQWGIDAGLAWAMAASATVVYVDYGISLGMSYGIRNAVAANRLIEYRFLFCKEDVPHV